MARWAASAKWGEAPALDDQCAMPLALTLSEVLGLADGTMIARMICFGKVRLMKNADELGCSGCWRRALATAYSAVTGA